MRITVFDLGREGEHEALCQEIKNHYEDSWEKAEVIFHHWDETEIRDCTGCWSCWWKTPGLCAIKDQASGLYKDYINSEKVILLFHTEQGFIDGKGKTFLDRLIQLYMPYIYIRNGECCHLKRYDSYPDIHIFFEKNGLNREEIKVIRDHMGRMAYHFHSQCKELLADQGSFRTVELKHTKPLAEMLSHQVTEREPAGKWVIYNGSPRGIHSNSRLIIEKIVVGMKAQGAEQVEVRDLIQKKNHARWAEEFSLVENHLFVFPLYVHAMPGIVMKFFQQLKPVDRKEVHMAFFVQSGFPENSQSYYLRPYLELLTKRLGVSFDGTIIKGGVEGLRMKPEKANKQFFDEMEQIGKTYVQTGLMDRRLKEKYEKLKYLPKAAQFFYSLLSLTGLTDFYWNLNLKKNGAYKNRYDKPYRNE